MYRHVDARLEAYRRVEMAYTPKRSCTGNVDTRPGAYMYVNKDYTTTKAGTGTWMHVKRRTGTFRGPTHGKGPIQVRGFTFRDVQARAQSLHTLKGRYRYVDTPPDA